MFKGDPGESDIDTASASKRRHNGRTGLDVGRVLSANICKML